MYLGLYGAKQMLLLLLLLLLVLTLGVKIPRVKSKRKAEVVSPRR